MKKIVPFNNVLTFSTDVCEITAISLEHDIKTDNDSICGTFFISGEYKITDGQLEKEKFKFELPFDIALGTFYDMDTLVVDIDDFRYELVERNKLKINIELYIDGVEKDLSVSDGDDELKEEEESILEYDNQEVVDEPIDIDIKEIDIPMDNDEREYIDDRKGKENGEGEVDLLSDMLDDEGVNVNQIEINDENVNENMSMNNIFNGFTGQEKYVTYRVYRVVDGDTIDKIMEQYSVTKEELAKYNNIEEIRPGYKLIIPYNDK